LEAVHALTLHRAELVNRRQPQRNLLLQHLTALVQHAEELLALEEVACFAVHFDRETLVVDV